MRTTKNVRVRDALKKHGVFLWEVAKAMHVSESTMTRMMREELQKGEQDKMIKIIEEIAKNGK